MHLFQQELIFEYPMTCAVQEMTVSITTVVFSYNHVIYECMCVFICLSSYLKCLMSVLSVFSFIKFNLL